MKEIECIKNGIIDRFKTDQNLSLGVLGEWQECTIAAGKYDSVSIVIDGKIYSTLEA